MSFKSEHKIVQLEARIADLETLVAKLMAEREERQQTLKLPRRQPNNVPPSIT